MKTFIPVIEGVINCNTKNLSILTNDDRENINMKYTNTSNIKNFIKDDENVMPLSDNNINHSTSKVNLNTKMSDYKTVNSNSGDESLDREDISTDLDKTFVKNKRKCKFKRVVGDKIKKEKVDASSDLVMNCGEKLTLNDKKKELNVKCMDKTNICKSIPSSDNIDGPNNKNDIKLGGNIYIDKKGRIKSCLPVVKQNLKNSVYLTSIPNTDSISYSKKKITINSDVIKRKPKSPKKTFTLKKDYTEMEEHSKNNFETNDIILNGRSRSINDLFDETLDLFCNSTSDCIPITNFEIGVSEFGKPDETFFDSEAFVNIKEQNEFNKEMLTTIFGKKEVYEESENIIDSKHPSIVSEIISKDVNHHLKRNKGPNVSKILPINNSNRVTSLPNIHSSSDNIYPFKNDETSEKIEINNLSEVEEFHKNDLKNYNTGNEHKLNVPFIPKTIVKISKGEKLIQERKGHIKPTSPLVTNNQPLEEISIFDLYNNVSLHNLDPNHNEPYYINESNFSLTFNEKSENECDYANSILREEEDFMDFISQSDDFFQHQMETNEHFMNIILNSNQESTESSDDEYGNF